MLTCRRERRDTWGAAAILESSLTETWQQAAGLGTSGPSPAWSETLGSMLTMAPDILGDLGISALREVWGLVTPRLVLPNHPREKHYQILVLRPCPQSISLSHVEDRSSSSFPKPAGHAGPAYHRQPGRAMDEAYCQ